MIFLIMHNIFRMTEGGNYSAIEDRNQTSYGSRLSLLTAKLNAKTLLPVFSVLLIAAIGFHGLSHTKGGERTRLISFSNYTSTFNQRTPRKVIGHMYYDVDAYALAVWKNGSCSYHNETDIRCWSLPAYWTCYNSANWLCSGWHEYSCSMKAAKGKCNEFVITFANIHANKTELEEDCVNTVQRYLRELHIRHYYPVGYRRECKVEMSGLMQAAVTSAFGE